MDVVVWMVATAAAVTVVFRRLLAFLALARAGMAPLTVSVPILGSLSADQTSSVAEIIGLGAVGLCAHLFGFGLNALIDAPLDRTLPGYQHHPFATGQLNIPQTRMMIAAQIPLALGIYAGLMAGTITGIALLTMSIAASVVYNLWSKWGSLPRILPELALAASIALLGLSGAFLHAESFSWDALIFAATLGLILLLVNSLPSGLKDLKTDAEFGARSFVLASGATVQGADGIYIPRGLHLYGAVLQVAITAGLLALIFRWEVGVAAGGLALLLTAFAGLHLRMLLAVRSFAAIRQSKPLLNGYYNFVALLMTLTHRMAAPVQVLLWALALLLLMLPLRLGWRLWRGRYQLIDA